jgi:hypothetical protein
MKDVSANVMKPDVWKDKSTISLELNFIISQFIANEVLEPMLRWGGRWGKNVRKQAPRELSSDETCNLRNQVSRLTRHRES